PLRKPEQLAPVDAAGRLPDGSSLSENFRQTGEKRWRSCAMRCASVGMLRGLLASSPRNPHNSFALNARIVLRVSSGPLEAWWIRCAGRSSAKPRTMRQDRRMEMTYRDYLWVSLF